MLRNAHINNELLANHKTFIDSKYWKTKLKSLRISRDTGKLGGFISHKSIKPTKFFKEKLKKIAYLVLWTRPDGRTKKALSWYSKSYFSILQWSFGVFLWELMTKAQQPFGDIDPFEMESYLNEGYRLHQPLNCPDQLYSGENYFRSSIPEVILIWWTEFSVP